MHGSALSLIIMLHGTEAISERRDFGLHCIEFCFHCSAEICTGPTADCHSVAAMDLRPGTSLT